MLAQGQGAILTELRFAERFYAVPDTMRNTQPQRIVRFTLKVESPSGLESTTAAKQQKRNIVKGMAVAFAEFVQPDNLRVIQH